MKHDIYQKLAGEEDYYLELMRQKVAETMGVTLAGNRLTVRFSDPNDRRKNPALVQIHMVILEVDDGEMEQDGD